MRKPGELFIVSVPARYVKTVLVDNCHSKAEAIRCVREAATGTSIPGHDIEAIGFETDRIYWSTVEAVRDTKRKESSYE